MNEKRLTQIIIIISIVVPTLVAILFKKQWIDIDTGFDVHIFPKFHALLNSLTAICLLLGFYCIKNKYIKAHKTFNLSAFALSALFLVSYVTYHSISESTKFGGEGVIRYIYYFILITHIVLAAAILPLILFTFMKALNGRIEQHRKLARYTFPLWLYVAVSGVVVYFMISPYYQ